MSNRERGSVGSPDTPDPEARLGSWSQAGRGPPGGSTPLPAKHRGSASHGWPCRLCRPLHPALAPSDRGRVPRERCTAVRVPCLLPRAHAELSVPSV